MCVVTFFLVADLAFRQKRRIEGLLPVGLGKQAIFFHVLPRLELFLGNFVLLADPL